jgi:hypothetical protein
MRPIGLLLVVLLAEGISHGAAAASSGDTKKHGPCVDLKTSPPSEEDTAAFRRVLGAVPVDPDTISLYVSHDPQLKKYGGAISFACEMPSHEIYVTYEKWIIYDPDLIQGDQARDFVFAHEIAHHMDSQTLSGPRSKKEELRADYDGAQYLIRLGWNKSRLFHALDLLNLPQDSQPAYPSLKERKAVVEQAAEPAQPQPPTNLQGTAVSASPPPFDELMTRLLNSTYQGPIHFQSARTNKYVCAVGTPDLNLPSTSTFAFFDNCELDSRGFFHLRISPYNNLSYWIQQDTDPCPDYAENCQHALESIGHQLQFWNQNLAADAVGWEKELGEQDLFSFEASDPAEGLVRIKDHKGGYVFVDSGTAQLQSGGSPAQAAEFKVSFDNDQNQ